ncbi:MAG: polymerase III, delta prime subunit protein [Microgenomates group bacterium GW2011_GWC1_43_13]|uniref:Polymerase III subunit gamma and tau protein n=3 Tax=Candidatus Woeseibacteriota TaxID=1752722 RepID=A0A837ICI9_9BACT|nr:MAG: polymerase III, delta prime subunit protein [Microgenomates group bacterium GW2011_GWC1_43_13]KKT32417.1 MAG: polymerase III subunit gamma and tau protein [Candidatus Woesebacteria bacterium GW2011_GWB1_44_11]KKT54096.1 MAG: polymerase III subunit gamma and tau protein [Candidatus Woesebacteria bacterium GW2011_GWA1_44_23]OGM76542.1 MAG: hypothetical protein A2208_02770 [Candidatus Woesebacteria bacterium RIFOXYA1_FULL_43_16]OGM82415.1 MAG: hypothetical protein A2394_02855 [Candidatus W
MHAYLLVGQEGVNLEESISGLAKKLHAKTMEFPLSKIDDTRSLNNLIRLSFSEPTLIVCSGIHEAGDAALNAFLKNLEEPQENIYFVLTAPSVRKVLPTIVSRCEVIRVPGIKRQAVNLGAEEFIKMTTGEKLAYVDKIKDREKAIELAENLINLLHGVLHSQKNGLPETAKNLEVMGKTLRRLKANGNVSLDLTSMVVSLV